MQHKLQHLLAGLALAGLGAVSADAGKPVVRVPDPLPALTLTSGERLEYELSWGFVTAAHASLTTLRLPTFGDSGEPAWQFRLSAATTPVLDSIYKVRVDYESWAGDSLQSSLGYRVRREFNAGSSETQATFDADRGLALAVQNGQTQPLLAIPDGTFETLGLVAKLRLAQGELEPGNILHFNASDGLTSQAVLGRVLRTERIRTPAGEFDTCVVEPELGKVQTVFEPSADARIQVWITRDARRLPVKLRSKVLIGWFTAELKTIQTPPVAMQ